MSEREKILRYYRSTGDGDLAARLLDQAEAALRSRKFRVTDFLDPFGYTVAETIAHHFPRLRLEAEGGYPGAERVRAAFVDDDFMGTVDFGLTVLAFRADPRYVRLSHRDVLGALMALGVKREVIGDIVIQGGAECRFLVDSAIESFVRGQMTSVGPAPVTVEKVDASTIPPREEKVREIRATAASMRLDAIAAAGFGTSRTKMAADIDLGKVKVNWQDAKNAAQAVKPGDIISIRGRGRVEIVEVPGQTKKGRHSVVLKRYI